MLTAALSGLAYSLQNYLFSNYGDLSYENRRSLYNIFRFIRMTLLYVLPAIWFTYRWGGNTTSLGVLPKHGHISTNIIMGISLYTIASIIFVKNDIFFSGWRDLSWSYIWINFALVSMMAAITDFWTRGFILFELSRKTNDMTAIFWQNITWFVIHIYEIELLIPYIGLFNAIALTLVLGIGGDVIALRTKSIFGLMLGHISLNLMILLAAKEVFVLI